MRGMVGVWETGAKTISTNRMAVLLHVQSAFSDLPHNPWRRIVVPIFGPVNVLCMVERDRSET